MTSSTHPPETVTAELHVRSLAPRAGRGQQESAIDRLDRLESSGRLESFSVNVWGRQVSLSTAAADTDAGQFVLDRVEEFREWARENGRSLDSFFETRKVSSSVTGENYASLVLPMVTLAEYHDGDLAFVAPSSNGESVCTVADRIDVLESTTVSGVLEADEATSGGLVAEEAEE